MFEINYIIIANSIDGVYENIPGHFNDIYKHLYNSLVTLLNLMKSRMKLKERLILVVLRMSRKLRRK